MNICKSDIYFILLLGIIIYLYSLYKKEPFQTSSTSSTTTNYITDIRSIKNLSSLASQLTLSNVLTTQNDLNIISNLTVKTSNASKQLQFGEGEIKFRGDSKAHYSITNSGGIFKISNTTSSSNLNSGFVNDILTSDISGNINIFNTLTTSGIIYSISGFKTKGGNNGNPQDNTTYFLNSDGKNYIRGDTTIDCSNVNVNGILSISGNLIVTPTSIPTSNIYIDGSFSYSGTDNGSKCVATTLSITTSSPDITVTGNNIVFNKLGVYCLYASFSGDINTSFNSANSGGVTTCFFSIVDTSGNLPMIFYSKSISNWTDSADHYSYLDDLTHMIKTNNSSKPYPNNNSSTIMFIPTVGTNYNISSQKMIFASGTFFTIYGLN